MLKRLTYNEVKEYVIKNSDCELLSTEYKNAKTTMKFKCKCGKEFETNFDIFKNKNKRQCKDCGVKSRNRNKRFTYEQVKSYVENESDCLLLSKEYIDCDTKMEFKCKCGSIFYTSFDAFKRNKQRQCKKCGVNMRSSKQALTTQDILNFLKENNATCELLSEYKNQKTLMAFKCECENIFTRTYTNLKFRKGFSCFSCSKERAANARRFSYEQVKSFIENNSDCKLLSSAYINYTEPLILQCSCGNKFKTDLSSFKQKHKRQCYECGIELRASLKRLPLEEVQRYVDENSDCKLLSKTFKNSTTKLLFKCNCGKKFYKTLNDFKNGQNRCPKCAITVSSYELLTEKWLVENNIKFLPQYKFKECRDKKELPFDFYIPTINTCVEIDGELHFKTIKKFNNDLELQQEHDYIKTMFCKDNNIKLLRIPYWEFKNKSYIKILEKNIKNADLEPS